MLIQTIATSDYFQASKSLKNYKNHNWKQNAIDFISVISYFTVIIPLVVGVIVGLASLCGRVSMNSKFPTDDKMSEAGAVLKQPNSSKISQNTKTLKNSSSQAPLENIDKVHAKNVIIQIPESVIIRPYPGELSDKNHLRFEWESNDKWSRKIVFKKTPHIQFSIRKQDIFTSGAELIVNAANSHLGGGGGIDGQIHSKGGDEYGAAHRKLKSKYPQGYPSGHAAMIDSGQLKANYNIDNVIVVAGPSSSTPTPKEESELYSCYYNSLMLANSQNKTKIAFPSISTGLFGFPLDRAAHISLRAVNDFIINYPNTNIKTISIHFLPEQDIDFVTYMTAIDSKSEAYK